jgi:hypothetical protein
MSERRQASKVFYRPIEAAIRWAGLLRWEDEVLRLVPTVAHPLPKFDCPRWGEVWLYTARIYDAIFHGELPYGRNGITEDDKTLWNSPDLTVRHTDLKKWMRDHYPEQRPGFLFSRIERKSHSTITVEAAQGMIVEQHTLKTELEQSKRQFQELKERHQALQEQHQELLRKCGLIPALNEPALSDRAEVTYQNIIGAMLSLLLGHSPGGTPYSSFHTQDAVISALIAHHGELVGITERTLRGKFAQSRRRVREVAS